MTAQLPTKPNHLPHYTEAERLQGKLKSSLQLRHNKRENEAAGLTPKKL